MKRIADRVKDLMHAREGMWVTRVGYAVFRGCSRRQDRAEEASGTVGCDTAPTETRFR
jgi:hypothetical protein